MAKEIKISDRSIRRILKNDLKVKPYKVKRRMISHQSGNKSDLRAKELLRLSKAESGQFPNIVFSDEKIFQIEQFVSSQNDRVYLTDRSYENLSHRLATRTQAPVTGNGLSRCKSSWALSNSFLDSGVKVHVKYYRQSLLEVAYKPWTDKYFGGRLTKLE